MNGKFGRFLTALGIALCLSCPAVLADVFGSGANSFSIDFVSIGNPGNPLDTTAIPILRGQWDTPIGLANTNSRRRCAQGQRPKRA